MVDVKQQEQHWNKIANNYDTFYGYDKPLHQRKIERKANLLITYGRVSENTRILELGCGTGAYTKYLVDTGAEVNAGDISEEMMNVAYKQKHIKANYWIMDCHNLKYFQDNSLDAVVGAYILQYLDLKKLVPELRRVLKHGGRICFIEPNQLNPVVFFFSKMKMTKHFGRPEFSNSFNRWQFDYTNFHLNVWPIEPRFMEGIPLVRELCGSLVIEGYKV